MTGAWLAYSRVLPAEKHIIGKRWTQCIEQYNFNLRTSIGRLSQKTICFSKSREIHDNIIWWDLTIHHYQ